MKSYSQVMNQNLWNVLRPLMSAYDQSPWVLRSIHRPSIPALENKRMRHATWPLLTIILCSPGFRLLIARLNWNIVPYQASTERPRVRNALMSVVAVPKKNPVSRAKSCPCCSEFFVVAVQGRAVLSEHGRPSYPVVPRVRSFLNTTHKKVQKGRALYCVVLVTKRTLIKACLVAKGVLTPNKLLLFEPLWNYKSMDSLRALFELYF